MCSKSRGGERLVWAVAGALVVALAVHEAGHVFVALRAGVRVRELFVGLGPVLAKGRVRGLVVSLRLFPVGAAVDIDDDGFAALPLRVRLFLQAAGPLANLGAGFLALFAVGLVWSRNLPVFKALAASVWFAFAALGLLGAALFQPGAVRLVGPVGMFRLVAGQAAPGADGFLLLFAALSFGVGLFNLLPLFPLDGGRIVLEPFAGRLGLAWRRRAERWGAAVLAALVVGVLVWDLVGPVVR